MVGERAFLDRAGALADTALRRPVSSRPEYTEVIEQAVAFAEEVETRVRAKGSIGTT